MYMIISKDFPQFEGETALFIVTGRQEADFLKASSGAIEKVADFTIETPRYSDREGHFKMRGHGMTFASGAVYEAKKEKILQDFRREFKKTLKKVLADGSPDRIYLYTPDYMVHEAQKLIPRSLNSVPCKIIQGNFYGEHPFELLKKIRNLPLQF